MNTIVVMIFSGKNEWSEGNPITMYSIINDESVNDNLDLIVVPQYGRNLDHTG